MSGCCSRYREDSKRVIHIGPILAPVSEFGTGVSLDPPRPTSLPLSHQRQTRNPGIPMPIPDSIRTAAETHLDRYCVGLIPKHVQDKIRLGYLAKGMAITLFELRPHWKDKRIWTKSDIARVRYSKTDGTWTLHWLNQHGKWHAYDPLPPTPDFGKVLREIMADPTGIFWG